jgi:hypothetical protein
MLADHARILAPNRPSFRSQIRVLDNRDHKDRIDQNACGFLSLRLFRQIPVVACSYFVNGTRIPIIVSARLPTDKPVPSRDSHHALRLFLCGQSDYRGTDQARLIGASRSNVLLSAVEFGVFTRLGGRRIAGAELGAELGKPLK